VSARELVLAVELVRQLVGDGSVIELTGKPAEREKQLRPTFDQVAARSGIPSAMLRAIAWTESNFAWRRGQLPEPIGSKLPDVPDRGLEGEERALGLMQIWSGHDGELMGRGWWPEPFTFRASGGGGDNWEDPTKNIVAGAQVLRDNDFGERRSREVLRRYSGARPENFAAIQDYVEKVTDRYLWLLGVDATRALTGG
jgi:hypothetical protein